MKSVTIVAEDRLGLLADISYILSKSNINIDGLFADVLGGKAVISLEVRDPKKAADVLGDNGFKTATPESIVIKVAGRAVSEITEMLEGEKVHVLGMSALSADDKSGIFAVSVDKPRKACKMLTPFLLGNCVSPGF